MTTQTLQFENGTVTLPRTAPRDWKDAKVAARITKDTMVFYRTGVPTLSDLLPKLRKAAKENGITKKNVEDAVRAVRKERGK